LAKCLIESSLLLIPVLTATFHIRDVVKHLRKTINIIILTLILIISESCGEVYKTTFANRNLFIFSNDIPKEREYFMTLEMRKEIWKYDYENNADSEKNMKFNYDLKSDILKFGFSDYEPVNGTEFKVEEL
jgi:hypothetical protein